MIRCAECDWASSRSCSRPTTPCRCLTRTGLPRPGVTRGFLKSSTHFPGEIVGGWLGGFYHLFLGYVLEAGFNDEEDDDVICPPGRVPMMTMHQSKGLEFPFVFVGHMGENPQISASHEMETLFSAYPANPARAFLRAPADATSRDGPDSPVLRGVLTRQVRAGAAGHRRALQQAGRAAGPVRHGPATARCRSEAPL